MKSNPFNIKKDATLKMLVIGMSRMISIYPAASRYEADHGWLKSRFSFSFAGYVDPQNVQFGPLRVFNDDIVQPSKGFGSHPHQEMEIVSVVLSGYLQHEDSTGEKTTSTFGQVQRMSAGTGVVHSEMNPSDTEEVHFLQMWFLPEEKGLTPSYEHSAFDPTEMKNRWLPIVSHEASMPGAAFIHQDLTIYLSEIEGGSSLTFAQAEGRRIYAFVIEGNVTLDREHTLKERDAARITDHPRLTVDSQDRAIVMLMDLP